MTYDVITSWILPALQFPTPEASAAWVGYVNFFEREMRKWRDLDIVNVSGHQMYFFEYTYVLKDWIYKVALQLGATVASGQQPATNNQDPFMQRQAAPARQPQQNIKTGKERLAEQLRERRVRTNEELERFFDKG